MTHRGWTLPLVLTLGAACGAPGSTPAVPPPPQSAPEVPGTGDFARQAFPAPLSVDDAERILVCTRTFEFGGMPPKRQVQAFNLLLDQPDARARFESIAAHAETAGKLYALCAFLAIGSPMTTSLASDLASSRATLLVQDSDVVLGWKAASEVVALIQSRRLWEKMRSAKEETARYFDKGA